MVRSYFRVRAGGRIILVLIALVVFTAGMFALASLLFDLDPDGHHLRDWLHDSRWGWFIWRMAVYAGIAYFWFYRVRPLLLTRNPEVRSRLPRTELIVSSFILFMEIVAWKGVA
jgi:hypothetical protein